MAGYKTITRYLPATFAWFILFTTTGLFFASPCQYLQNTYHYSITIFQALIVFFVITNLILATFMDPGVIPKASPDEDNEDDFRAPLYKSVDINGITVRMKWCVTCQFYRPPRCSHCSVCNTCIETFDHHCPWVNNCIGRRNYRHFFFFLISLSIHMITSFIWCLIYIFDHPDQLHERDSIISMVLIGVIIIAFFPIIILTGFHIILVARGRTTNEQMTGKFQTGYNPFTKGCFLNCCFILCGPQYDRYQSQKRKIPSKHFKNKFNSLNPSARYDNSMKVYIDEGNVLLFPKSSTNINNESSLNLDTNKRTEINSSFKPSIYQTDESPNLFDSRLENKMENQSKNCKPSPPLSPTNHNIFTSLSVPSPASRAHHQVYKSTDTSNFNSNYTSNTQRVNKSSMHPSSHPISHNHNYLITMRKTENGKTETTFPVTGTNPSRKIQSGHQKLYFTNSSSNLNYNTDQTSIINQQSHSNQTNLLVNNKSPIKLTSQPYSSQPKPFYNNPQPGGMVIYYSPDAGSYCRKSETDLEKNSLIKKELDDEKANNFFDNNDDNLELNETRSNQLFIKRPMSFIKALEISDKLEKQANARQTSSTKSGDETRQSQYEMNYEISV